MKALIYCRVSSQRQVVEGHGNSSQEQRCRVRAKEKNYQVEAVFPDDGVSGGLFDRPAMKKLINYLDEHPAEQYVIIFDDLARFARNLEVHLKLRNELIGRGAKLECLNFNFEDSPEGIFIENVLASKAQLDREQNKRQVIQKMKARLERGYWPFMPPLGMINKKDPIHGKILIPREPFASIYKTALEKYRDGLLLTQEEVMLYLHNEFKLKGFPNRLSMSTTQRILSEPLYAGYIKYEKWGVSLKKAQHEGFISFETYNINQQHLQQRTKPWKRRDYADTFPLRPHVLCDACSRPMTASWCTGRKGIRYPHYFCRNKDCIYKWKTTSKEKFETKFEELLFKAKPKSDMVDLTKDILREQWKIRFDSYTTVKSRVVEEIKGIDIAIQSYLVRIGKTQSEDLIKIYEEKIKELQEKKKLGEQELSKRKYTAEEFGTASDKVFNTLKNPVSMWKSNEYNDKRAILFMYFEENLRYDYKNGFGTTTLAYPLALIMKNRPLRSGSVEMSSNELESKKLL